MTQLILDTHAAVNELVSAGMPERQAETVVRQQARLLEQNLATKADIEAIKAGIETLRQETKAGIETLRQETKADIETLRQETKAGIETLRQETKADIETIKAGIETLRQETKADIETTRASIETLRQETMARIEAAKVDLIKWIFGLNLGTASLIVALIKLL